MVHRNAAQGWEPPHRIIAHIDMDAFYASVEVQDDPALLGKPVIVGGDSRRGVVSAASYEARGFGIHSAMPVYQAKRLCPDGVFLPVRMSRYIEVSRIVMGCLVSFSPLVEQVSVDEAYVDLTGTGRLFGSPPQAARAIKQRIRDAASLTCSIGISTSKLLAKIASDMNKPDGVTIIPPSAVAGFLGRLPIGAVPGIGKRTGEELVKCGIRHVGDVSRHPERWIRERFGAFGERLLQIARGDVGSPVVPYSQPKSMSSELTLPEDTADAGVLKRCLRDQSERVGRRLRRHGFRGRTITLKIKHPDFKQYTRSVTLNQPTCVGKVVYTEAVRLLEAYDLRSKVRLIGVGVSGLEPAGVTAQASLFSEGSTDEDRWERAERAVDEIIRRFGDGTVRPGRLVE